MAQSGSFFAWLCLGGVLMAQPLAAAQPLPAVASGRSYSGPPISVTTFQYDNSRSGWDARETDLTPSSIAPSGAFGVIAQLQVDGVVLGQPLLYAGYQMADGSVHDVLVVATMHNTVYAFDANTYGLLWRTNLGPSQVNSKLNFGYLCNNAGSEYGIAGTPVIAQDPSTGAMTLYLVAGTQPAATSFVWSVYALDLGSGSPRVSAPIAASVKLSGRTTVIRFDPVDQWSRTALAYSNGSLYFGVGAHCDRDARDIGWMFRYDQTLTQQAALPMASSPPGGSGTALFSNVWMSGFGPAVDAAGNVFIVTGNGPFLAPTASAPGDLGPVRPQAQPRLEERRRQLHAVPVRDPQRHGPRSRLRRRHAFAARGGAGGAADGGRPGQEPDVVPARSDETGWRPSERRRRLAGGEPQYGYRDDGGGCVAGPPISTGRRCPMERMRGSSTRRTRTTCGRSGFPRGRLLRSLWRRAPPRLWQVGAGRSPWSPRMEREPPRPTLAWSGSCTACGRRASKPTTP